MSGETIDGAEFIRRRAEIAARASAAAVALRRGERAPAASLLEGWFTGALPEAAALAIEQLRGFDPGEIAAALGPAESGLDLATPFEHLCAMADRHPGPGDGLAVALANLHALGERVRALEREGWAQAPAGSGGVAACWRMLALGGEQDAAAWRSHFEEPADTQFWAVFEESRVDDRRRRRLLSDMRGNLSLVLREGGGGIAGWREVALRAIELHTRGPLVALGLGMNAEDWTATARCLARRGAWAETLAQLWPAGPEAGLSAAGQRDPAALEDLASLHAIRRVLARWREGELHPRAALEVVRANRCALRGRLRARLAEIPAERLLSWLLSGDALGPRTWRAMCNFALAWAWRERRFGFPGSVHNEVTRPCVEPPADTPALDNLDRAALRGWILLVVLRGRLNHLERWLYEGTTGDNDATWGRLLTAELPTPLREPPVRGRPHRALHLALSLDLGPILHSLVPLLEELAALPPGRALPARFRAALAPVWTAAMPEPERGFERMQEHIRAALAERPVMEEDPWTL